MNISLDVTLDKHFSAEIINWLVTHPKPFEPWAVFTLFIYKLKALSLHSTCMWYYTCIRTTVKKSISISIFLQFKSILICIFPFRMNVFWTPHHFCLWCKKEIWRCHLRLWGAVMDIILYFLAIYGLNNSLIIQEKVICRLIDEGNISASEQGGEKWRPNEKRNIVRNDGVSFLYIQRCNHHFLSLHS